MIKNYLHLIRFNKPIGTFLLLYPTLWALWISSSGHPPLILVVVFTLGVFLTRAAGCAINDYADSNFDRHVVRTQNRPLVKGIMSKKAALWVCFALSSCAFILALVFLKWQTVELSIPALILFITYPFMKRYIAIPQAYLGIAFSFGILMVFMETLGNVSNPILWCLFAANLCWVIGYDTIYALVDIEDDLKIGIKTSAITFGSFVVPCIIVCYFLFIVLMGIVGVISYIHFTRLQIFYWIGLIIAVVLLTKQALVLITQQKEFYFRMFLLNNWVGLSILFGIVCSSQSITTFY